MYPINNSNTQMQSILAAASADGSLPVVMPHHPIACGEPSKLWYHEDGSFECEHTKIDKDDKRTQVALRHSIALLIIELAFETL